MSNTYDMTVTFEAEYGSSEYLGTYVSIDETMTCTNLFSHRTLAFRNVDSVSKAEKILGKFMEEN